MKRYINKRESPPCPIDEVEIYERFKQAWGATETAFYEVESNTLVYMRHQLSDKDVSEAIKDYVLS
jgi:hypothetical protein